MDEFLKAWAAMQITKPADIEFRIYYDPKTGNILNYTNDQIPGDYILVDNKTFHNHRFDLRVKDGKLVDLPAPIGKLRPSESGTPCEPDDITIVTTDLTRAVFWEMHNYDN